MAKQEKKSPKEASNTFHNIMKASVTPKKNNPMDYKETEMILPDGEKIYVVEVQWRNKRRLIVDSDSGKYSFALSEAGDSADGTNLTDIHKSAANYILKRLDNS